MFGNVLTGKGGGGLGGTYNYNELKNTPIINQDLTDGEIEAVNPIEIGETVTRFYYNTSATPDLSKLDWDNALGEASTGQYIILCTAKEDNETSKKEGFIAIKYPKGQTVSGIEFTADGYMLTNYNAFRWMNSEMARVLSAQGLDTSAIEVNNGWVTDKDTEFSIDGVLQVNQQDIWSGWVSKDGQWQKGSYKGEAGNYYRHIGDDKIVPVNPIEVGDVVSTYYFNTSIEPDFSKLNWEAEEVQTVASGDQKYYNLPIGYVDNELEIEYDYVITYVPAGTTLGNTTFTTDQYIILVGESGAPYATPEIATYFSSSPSGWLRETTNVGWTISQNFQQDIWGAWISKDGQWKTVYQKGSIYYYDGTDYKAVCTTDYVDNALSNVSGGTTDYNKLENAPIINKDLANDGYKAVNPIQIGDTITRLYFNKKVKPNFALLEDWLGSGESSNSVIIMTSGYTSYGNNQISIGRLGKKGEKLQGDDMPDSYYEGVCPEDQWMLVVADKNTVHYVYVSEFLATKMNEIYSEEEFGAKIPIGWCDEDYIDTTFGETVEKLKAQDIWGSWISKDGQWETGGKYYGEEATYYRHTGSTTDDFTNGKIYYYDGEYKAVDGNSDVDLSEYATTEYVDGVADNLNERLTAVETGGSGSDYYTKTEVDNAIASAITTALNTEV